MKKIIFTALIFTLISIGSFSKVLSPYDNDNKERLENNYGYCKNSAEEQRFWRAINIYAKSFIDEVPAISPESKIYIKNEVESANIERRMRMRNAAIYKMDSIYTNMKNIATLSEQYLMYSKRMSFVNKTEYIGRTMVNVTDDDFGFEEINEAVKSLSLSGYYISNDALMAQWAISRSLRTHLMLHLICYGENKN